MKKLLFAGLLSLLSLGNLYALDEEAVYRNLGTGVTNILASTTNTTAGEIMPLPTSPTPVRIWVKAMGYAATTNGGGAAVSNLVLYVSTASGNLSTTNDFDTASLSNIRLTVRNLQSATNVVSDYFELRGARFMRIGRIENNYVGNVSNITVFVGYPK